MSIYIDNARIIWANKVWCHLVADSLDELHAFAEDIGLKRQWFQASASYPHYDITLKTRSIALAKGAKIGSRKQIIYCAKKLKKEQITKRKKHINNQLDLGF